MNDPSSHHRLADEHAGLLQEVERRQQRVLDALDAARWPSAEIRALVAYLRYELLDQAANEERLLYPLTGRGFADDRIRELVEEHVRLRDVSDALAGAAAADAAGQDSGRLTSMLGDLRRHLEQHRRHEQEVMSTSTDSGIELLRRPYHSHEWFPMTEGAVLDMDRLPREFELSAVVERLTRMTSEERVQLRSGHSLEELQELFTRRGMATEYGWAYLEEGPKLWRADITRRLPPQ